MENNNVFTGKTVEEAKQNALKALNVSEAVILSNNPDLVFPLEKEERILIYRELNKE